jgi:hypothetical protein
MSDEASAIGGARFFDEQRRDRGWAGRVTRRIQRVSGLTVLDVVAPEPGLATFLTALDKARLGVKTTGTATESYSFVWASGYRNGLHIRIQGVVEKGSSIPTVA